MRNHVSGSIQNHLIWESRSLCFQWESNSFASHKPCNCIWGEPNILNHFQALLKQTNKQTYLQLYCCSQFCSQNFLHPKSHRKHSGLTFLLFPFPVNYQWYPDASGLKFAVMKQSTRQADVKSQLVPGQLINTLVNAHRKELLSSSYYCLAAICINGEQSKVGLSFYY